jgi:aspartyl-tRNA(Asn)/glutamyl-tRNA(Gln) amidotransferase subunit A
MHGRTRLFRRIQSWFDRFDILVTPTLTCPPLRATHPGSGDIEIDGRPAGDIRAAWAPTLGLFTMTGLVAATVAVPARYEFDPEPWTRRPSLAPT